MGFYLSVVIGSVLLTSFYEWWVHRFVMHRPVKTWFGSFKYPFTAHTRVHHHVFKADGSYHLGTHERPDADRKTIPMDWWNGPALCLAATSLTVVPSLLIGDWSLSLIFLGVCSAYYGVYEYIHWCMHLPKNHPMRLVERFWVFRRLNGHHLLHHRYMHKNFNVVLPFADLCCGTLLLRSRVGFAQATGPQVPDVQPAARAVESDLR